MRDAAGDVGPGRLALGRQQLGDVVESDDETADFAAIMFSGDAYQQGTGAGSANQLDL